MLRAPYEILIKGSEDLAVLGSGKMKGISEIHAFLSEIERLRYNYGVFSRHRRQASEGAKSAANFLR